MAYTDIDKPSDYFETKLYTGNAGTLNVTGLDFQPDWVWLKNRQNDYFHALYDSVRGTGNTKSIVSNNTDAEGASSIYHNLTAFNSDGFSLGTTSNINTINTNAENHVSWNWKAGTSFTNDASATGIGSIDSTGSVNTDAGFSIISYTGTGSNGTVAHGLGVTPKMIICKGRSFSTSAHWLTYHEAMGNTSAMKLNLTSAKETTVYYWNNTSPTSSTFSLGASTEANSSSATFIAYCFAEKQGYSKFGSYTGNGSTDGTFVYTGMKPAFLLYKNSTAGATNWQIHDSKRSPYNLSVNRLNPNDSSVELGTTADSFDFLSNGFKARATASNSNTSGATFIYMAFASNPFTTSTGVPATAR
jgi:hypothetical protein